MNGVTLVSYVENYRYILHNDLIHRMRERKCVHFVFFPCSECDKGYEAGTVPGMCSACRIGMYFLTF